MGLSREHTASVRRWLDVVLPHTQGHSTAVMTDRTRATVRRWHACISDHTNGATP